SWQNIRPDGGIGRHARFRFWCRKAWRFESSPGQSIRGKTYAQMVELVDTPDSGFGAERHGGSSPLLGTSPETFSNLMVFPDFFFPKSLCINDEGVDASSLRYFF